jgi:hypothetical protein
MIRRRTKPVKFWLSRLRHEHRGFYVVLELFGLSFDLTVSWRAPYGD